MKVTRTAVMLSLVIAAGTAMSALGQTTFRTGKVYNRNGGEISVVPRSMLDNRYTWYSPEIFTYPNGDLGFYAHANNPSVDRYGNSNSMSIAIDACTPFKPAGMDSIYGARRNSAGTWLTPAFAQCPKIKGMNRYCTYQPEVPDDPNVAGDYNIDATGSPSIVRIANANSSTGYRYYMLFNNGNSDISVGKVYWAVSDDGDNWTIHNTGAPAGHQWKPVLGSEYLYCNGGPYITGKDQGISEALLVHDPADTAGGRNPNGTFYIYFNYSHVFIDGGGIQRHYYDVLAYRFGYNPSHPFGFGANPELFVDGQWVAHSGRLVWSYDNQLPVPGDPVLDIAHSMLSWRQSTPHAIGRGDLKRNTDTGVWYHLSNWNGTTYMQWNTRLDMDNWTVPVEVNTASVYTGTTYAKSCTSNGGTATVEYDQGIWYGTLGGWRGWWMWQPVNAATPGTHPCFQGLGIVVAKLCMNNQAGCDT